MKKLYFGAAVLFLGLASCSTNDDNSNGNSTNFLPLTATSSWVYDVNLEGEYIARDSLYVSGENTLNGKIYKELKTKEMANGFYSNSLNNNNIRIDGNKLLLTGSTGLGLAEFIPITITLNDFVFFSENASNGAELDAISGTIEQNLQGLPLKIDYTLKSTFKESLSSFTVPGKAMYTNIKVMKVTANLKVSTEVEIPGSSISFPISILNSQDVIVSTHYYAEGEGMIYSKTDINYQLNDFSQAGIDLPIPQNGSSTIEEFLD